MVVWMPFKGWQIIAIKFSITKASRSRVINARYQGTAIIASNF
jgi:hypothetical protein